MTDQELVKLIYFCFAEIISVCNNSEIITIAAQDTSLLLQQKKSLILALLA